MSVSTQAQWNAALREVRKQGVAVKQNVMTSTRGEVDATVLKIDENDAFVFTYGGQNMATKWDDDVMVQRNPEPRRARRTITKVYFSHGNNGAETLVRVMKEFGFPVAWNGDNDYSVVVTPSL